MARRLCIAFIFGACALQAHGPLARAQENGVSTLSKVSKDLKIASNGQGQEDGQDDEQADEKRIFWRIAAHALGEDIRTEVQPEQGRFELSLDDGMVCQGQLQPAVELPARTNIASDSPAPPRIWQGLSAICGKPSRRQGKVTTGITVAAQCVRQGPWLQTRGTAPFILTTTSHRWQIAFGCFTQPIEPPPLSVAKADTASPCAPGGQNGGSVGQCAPGIIPSVPGTETTITAQQ